MNKLIGLLTVFFVASTSQVFAQNKVYKIGDTTPTGGFIVSRTDKYYTEASKEDLKLDVKDYVEKYTKEKDPAKYSQEHAEDITEEGSNKYVNKFNFEAAEKECKNLREGGFTNWILPGEWALKTMHKNLAKNNIGTFAPDLYWSSEFKFSEGEGQNYYFILSFVTGNFLKGHESWTFHVRCVRTGAFDKDQLIQ